MMTEKCRACDGTGNQGSVVAAAAAAGQGKSPNSNLHHEPHEETTARMPDNSELVGSHSSSNRAFQQMPYVFDEGTVEDASTTHTQARLHQLDKKSSSIQAATTKIII